jgi:hypothetical protein
MPITNNAMNESNTRRPPWRGIIFALVAMAIQFCIGYPHFKKLHMSELGLWIMLPITGLFFFVIGSLPSFLKKSPNAQAWVAKRRPLLVWIIFVLLIFYWLWQLHDMPRGH